MRDKVIRELMGNYGCVRNRAMIAVEAHPDIITDAETMGSLPYYPAQQIAQAEGLTYTGMLDEKKKIRDAAKLHRETAQGWVIDSWWSKCKEHYDDCFDPKCLMCETFEEYAIASGALEDE